MIDKPLMESSLLPLAYMAVNGQGDNVDCVCEACAIEQAGGSIDSYNLARGFDWVGEWIDPPDEGEDEDEYQKSKGLAVGDPVYVLFGEGLTINQVRCFDLEGIAETLGIDVNNIEVEGFPAPEAHEMECARCDAACVSVDATKLQTSDNL